MGNMRTGTEIVNPSVFIIDVLEPCVASIKCKLAHFDSLTLSSNELLQRLSLLPVDVYVFQQQLRCAGHVMRMLWDRLPRKMILKRPKCYPNLTCGRSLKKSLKKADVDIKN